MGEPFTSNGTLYMMLEGGKIVPVDKDGNQIDGPPFTGNPVKQGAAVVTPGVATVAPQKFPLRRPPPRVWRGENGTFLRIV
ncbi:MAG: hypothetical protein WCK89_24890 [bacterium]